MKKYAIMLVIITCGITSEAQRVVKLFNEKQELFNEYTINGDVYYIIDEEEMTKVIIN